MNIGMENEITEFKKSTSELSDGIVSLVAMLNKSGEGTLYFGVKNNGDVIGQKDITENTLRDISRLISERIKPQVIPHITTEFIADKQIIKVYVKREDIPYSASGKYYSRSFDEDRQLEPNQIKNLLNKEGEPDRMVQEEAYNQDLTFETLKGLYRDRGLSINEEQFEKNLKLVNRHGKYNILGELLSDSNDNYMIVATFKGNDKTELIKRNDYGGKCLALSVLNVIEYVSSLKETKVKLGYRERIEEDTFDLDCFREAWLNAVLHNRLVNGTPPAVYIYSDKIEIVSEGGLPSNLSLDEYFSGVSRPVNRALLKVFKDLNLVEDTGHGVPLIVKTYGKKIFNITENTIRIYIPINNSPIEDNFEILNDKEKEVVKLLKDKPNLTNIELSKELGVSDRYIRKITDNLSDKGYIERIGSNKVGYWSVLK